MRFKVGEKVWVYLVATWVGAVVVPKPDNMVAKRGRVFIQIDGEQDVYRYNKEFVRKFL
jgi:hypothetical protein